jgi:hypothetical protein
MAHPSLEALQNAINYMRNFISHDPAALLRTTMDALDECIAMWGPSKPA